ncbi:hypothetical protein OIDMADRAFT_34166 [Oidiodendron maius Zn]|uniref:Uncharacterized protein n=1 Tax=Oidiodendron maius (strain Zn) TaxID=913774 RepID=A0A0C3C918_OIDMZ|nr:hypothetical protein OIDMADRAFT_34166 [Oidiodendron maius Zn]
MAKKREWIRGRLEKVGRKVKWPLQKRKPETGTPLSPPSQPTIDTPRASPRIFITSNSALQRRKLETTIDTPRASPRIFITSNSALQKQKPETTVDKPRASPRIFITSNSALQKQKPKTDIPLSTPSQPSVDTPRALPLVSNTSNSALQKQKPKTDIPLSSPSQPSVDTPRASPLVFKPSNSAPSQSPIYTSGAWQDSIETPTTPESISARIRRDVERYEQSLKAKRTLSAPPVLQSSGSPVSLASTVTPPSVASTSFRPMVVSVERGKSMHAFASAYGPNAVPKVLPINMRPLTDSYYYKG